MWYRKIEHLQELMDDYLPSHSSGPGTGTKKFVPETEKIMRQQNSVVTKIYGNQNI